MQRLLDLLPADGLQSELRDVLADGDGGDVSQLPREVGEGVWSLDVLTACAQYISYMKRSIYARGSFQCADYIEIVKKCHLHGMQDGEWSVYCVM